MMVLGKRVWNIRYSGRRESREISVYGFCQKPRGREDHNDEDFLPIMTHQLSCPRSCVTLRP